MSNTSGTKNSWTTPRCLSWTVTLCVGTEAELVAVPSFISTGIWSSDDVVLRRHFVILEWRRLLIGRVVCRLSVGFRWIGIMQGLQGMAWSMGLSLSNSGGRVRHARDSRAKITKTGGHAVLASVLD